MRRGDRILERVATARAATATARAAWIDQVKQAGPFVASASALLVGLHDFVRAHYGRSSSTLVDFGMTPAARRARTAAETVATAQKAKATRIARHTMGAAEGGDSWRTATRRAAAAARAGAVGVTAAAPLQHAERRAPSLEPVDGRRYVATRGCMSSVRTGTAGGCAVAGGGGGGRGLRYAAGRVIPAELCTVAAVSRVTNLGNSAGTKRRYASGCRCPTSGQPVAAALLSLV
jgi:hypothetical protein